VQNAGAILNILDRVNEEDAVSATKRHSRNPRQALDGVTPKQRGQENENKLLTWVACAGFISSTIGVLVSGRKAPAVISRLVKRGLLRCVTVETFSKGQVWMLTRDGYSVALALMSSAPDYEFDPSKAVKPSYVRHQLAIQHVVLPMQFTSVIIDQPWIVESLAGQKRPDAVLTINHAFRTAIEVELTEKHGRELHQMLLRLANYIGSGHANNALIVSHSNALLNNYKKMLHAPDGLIVWERGLNGSVKAWRPAGRIVIPERIRSNIFWVHCPNLFLSVL
jgi:hypothetical protein